MNSYNLWPKIKPFEKNYLKVSELHKIRYALYGNPVGTPIFFLHGGPGCGSDDEDARWFDPDKFCVVTHDQRGSGRSIPRAEIKENSPKELVEDIERLRIHLKIKEPISIFAGSWGSTLALLYAENYPENV
jgi:proline iminopeptidase